MSLENSFPQNLSRDVSFHHSEHDILQFSSLCFIWEILEKRSITRSLENFKFHMTFPFISRYLMSVCLTHKKWTFISNDTFLVSLSILSDTSIHMMTSVEVSTAGKYIKRHFNCYGNLQECFSIVFGLWILEFILQSFYLGIKLSFYVKNCFYAAL